MLRVSLKLLCQADRTRAVVKNPGRDQHALERFSGKTFILRFPLSTYFDCSL